MERKQQPYSGQSPMNLIQPLATQDRLPQGMPPPTESAEQQALFQWAEFSAARYPELEMMYHIPNGGSRTKSEAGRFRAEGVKAGVPDICLPVPRGGFHGLYIEMKRIDGRVSDQQAGWLQKLGKQGYCTVVCYGFKPAQHAVETYLNGHVSAAISGPPFIKPRRITNAMLGRIQAAMGFELRDWQVEYLRTGAQQYNVGRVSGKTTMYCIALALSEGPPILGRELHQYADMPRLNSGYSRIFFPSIFLEIWKKLKTAGLPVRKVIERR